MPPANIGMHFFGMLQLHVKKSPCLLQVMSYALRGEEVDFIGDFKAPHDL